VRRVEHHCQFQRDEPPLMRIQTDEYASPSAQCPPHRPGPRFAALQTRPPFVRQNQGPASHDSPVLDPCQSPPSLLAICVPISPNLISFKLGSQPACIDLSQDLPRAIGIAFACMRPWTPSKPYTLGRRCHEDSGTTEACFCAQSSVGAFARRATSHHIRRLATSALGTAHISRDLALLACSSEWAGLATFVC